MKIPIYETFNEFKENYIADFTNQNEYNYYNYLINLGKNYTEIHNNKLGENEKILDSLNNEEWSILEKLEELLPSDIYLILFHDLWADYSNETEENVIENPSLFYEIIDGDKKPGTYGFICDFFDIKKKQKIIEEKKIAITSHYLDYLKLIENEKREIEIQIKKPQPTTETHKIPEIDYSGKGELKPKQKLIILNELGVIDFINEKLQDKGNATHLSEILNTILGVGQDTLRGYVNLLIRPDETQRNSPYNSEKVVAETRQIINKFKLKENGSR